MWPPILSKRWPGLFGNVEVPEPEPDPLDIDREFLEREVLRLGSYRAFWREHGRDPTYSNRCTLGAWADFQIGLTEEIVRVLDKLESRT